MKKQTSLPVAEIIDRYQRGDTPLKIKLECGLPHSTEAIRNVLRRNKVPLRPRGGYHPRRAQIGGAR